MPIQLYFYRSFLDYIIIADGITTIDKVEDNGTSIYGQFHSDTWGDFKTYFKFYISKEGRIYKLEIGQADY